MKHEYSFLLEDPFPDLPDSPIWLKLFRTIPLIKDKGRADVIHKLLWSVRSYGVLLKWTPNGLFFVPNLEGKCDFDSLEEFSDMKQKYFTPYREEIAWVLRKVAGNE